MNGIVNKPFTANALTFMSKKSYKDDALNTFYIKYFIDTVAPYVKIVDLYGQISIFKYETLKGTNYFTFKNSSGDYSPSFSINYINNEGIEYVDLGFNNNNLSLYIFSVDFGLLE
jgi:hypothetical protein|nr:MAG TPA: hypothetical protein [Caudoviricetes sp.]